MGSDLNARNATLYILYGSVGTIDTPAGTHLQIVTRYKANDALSVPGLVPLGIRLGAVQDLQAVPLIEAQLLLVIGPEGVESDDYVQDVLRHGISMEGVVIALRLGVIGGEPPLRCAALPSPPAVVALLQDEYPSAFDQRQLVRLLGLVVVLHDGGSDRLGRVDGKPARDCGRLHGSGRRIARWKSFRS